MENIIQVTDNYSITEEKYHKMVDAMKQYWDELGDLCNIVVVPDTNEKTSTYRETLNEMSKNEAAQALMIIFVNTFTEGAIASVDDRSLLKEFGGGLSEEEKEEMRNQSKQLLTQIIFNRA